MDYKKLNTFLNFCFLTDFSTEIIDPVIADPDAFREQLNWQHKASMEKLVEMGSKLLRKILKEKIPLDSERTIVSPISGGLDSRAILAYLVGSGKRDSVRTVTYGTPKTHDFEIGRLIANFAGVSHQGYDLTEEKLTREKLSMTASEGAAWINLSTAYYNRIVVHSFGNDVCYISGFLGGEIACNPFFTDEDKKLDWEQAKTKYWNRVKWEENQDIVLTDGGFDYRDVFPAEPFLEDPGLISYPEQMDLCIRMQTWIKKAIVNVANTVITPYTHPEWVRFMLAMPYSLRKNKEIYKSILARTFPDYYSLPIKNLSGKPILYQVEYEEIVNEYLGRELGKDRNENYIDFTKAYKARKDFVEIAEESLFRLEEHATVPWLDMANLWRRYRTGELEAWRTIELLVSLEISLETEKNPV